MKQTGLLLLLNLIILACAHRGVAQGYSYVYIQGDKETPFYVKLEGEMLPRYGKHYCIIPRLETGVIHVEILFQQNAYPPQQFAIKVPERGSRNFLLTRKDQTFSLFDLLQGFYLPAGGSEQDDYLAPDRQTAPVAVSAPSNPVVPSPKPARTTEPAAPPPSAVPSGSPGSPQFIEDMELDNEPHTLAREEPHTPVAATGSPDRTTSDNAPRTVTPGTECTQPVSEGYFDQILAEATGLESEEARLGYMNGLTHYCYTTGQTRQLVGLLESDAARYSWLKKIHARITDPADFPRLEEVFGSQAWKDHFLDLTR